MARGAVGVAGDRSLMVPYAIEIEPEHRGVNLALVVADRLVDGSLSLFDSRRLVFSYSTLVAASHPSRPASFRSTMVTDTTRSGSSRTITAPRVVTVQPAGAVYLAPDRVVIGESAAFLMTFGPTGAGRLTPPQPIRPENSQPARTVHVEPPIG